VETLVTSTSAPAPQDDAPRDEPGAASLPDRSPRRLRWRVWISLCLALLVLRLASPIILAPMLASRLSRVLGTRVDVGDVSFAPIDAVVGLRNVTVAAPDAMGVTAGGAPVIVADRVRLDVQWLPLLHRTVLVRELTLESARIALDRPTGGRASLETFLRADPASELPPNWTFALDRIVLRDATIHLRGAADGDPAAPEVRLRDARVSTLPRRATAFGRAPNLRIDAAVEGGGRIRVDGSSDLRDHGAVLDTDIHAKDVPLAPLRALLPDLDWSGVGGLLSARLHYRRDPARRDLVTGRMIARRIAVHVPALVEPALVIHRAIADVEGIDLLARRVTIGSLTLHGATLAARPDLAAPIPLLAGARSSSAAVSTPRPQALPNELGGKKAPPWRWIVTRLAIPSGRVRFGGRDGSVGVAARLLAENLGPSAYWSPLRAWVRHGDGAAAFDGTARITQGLVIDGRLTAGAIDVPDFARTVGVPWADLVRSGGGAVDLNLEFAPSATDGSVVDAHGRVSLVDLSVAGPDANAFAFDAAAVELELAGIFARRNDAHGRGSIELRISEATVGAPQVRLTRTSEGWVLPPFAGDENRPAAATVAAADERFASSPHVQLAAARIRANGGRVTIVDSAARPSVAIDLAVSEGWGRNLRLPGLTLGDFALAGSDRRLGALRLSGTQDVEGRGLELSGEAVPLAAAAPFFVRADLPYRLEGGTASFLSRIAVGTGHWTADTTISLRDPTVVGDTVALRQALGVPVETAFAALRDPSGDVILHLALAAPRGDMRTFPDAVAGAVRDAIARGDQGLVPDQPLRIAFAPGHAELTAQGAQQIAAIARILNAGPDLVIDLAAPVSIEDRQWLAAQALVDDLKPARGFKSVLRTFGIRNQRERIQRALEQRADGRPGRLDADDEAALDNMLAHRAPVEPGRLAALAAARVSRVRAELASRHRIAPARVVVGDTPPDDGAAAPGVRCRIGVDPHVAPLSAPGQASEATTHGGW
jgi:hypothetical protein